MTRIVFHSHIIRLEKRDRLIETQVIDRSKSATPDNITQTRENLGWFMALEGSCEAIYVGEEKPKGWGIGDVIRTTMEKIS